MFSSPFGGIPRNWKHLIINNLKQKNPESSPFGGIPRNWKPLEFIRGCLHEFDLVPPSGGSLEIGN